MRHARGARLRNMYRAPSFRSTFAELAPGAFASAPVGTPAPAFTGAGVMFEAGAWYASRCGAALLALIALASAAPVGAERGAAPGGLGRGEGLDVLERPMDGADRRHLLLRSGIGAAPRRSDRPRGADAARGDRPDHRRAAYRARAADARLDGRSAASLPRLGRHERGGEAAFPADARRGARRASALVGARDARDRLPAEPSAWCCSGTTCSRRATTAPSADRSRWRCRTRPSGGWRRRPGRRCSGR